MSVDGPSRATVSRNHRVLNLPGRPAVLFVIFFAALAWRLLLFRGGVPFVDVDLRGDEGNYLALAKGLLETGQFVDRWAWTRPPLYPLFLALILSASRFDLAPAVLAQAVLGALTALLVAVLAAREYGHRTGTVAGVLAALDPTAPLQTLYLFSEGLSMPFALLGVILALRGLRGGQVRWFLAAGVALGIGTLARVTVLPIAVSVALWLSLRQLRQGILPQQGVMLLLGLAVALAPWTARNWAVYHRPLLVDNTLGVNLYQYNSDLSRREVYSELMRIPNPADRQAHGIAMAMRWIAAHPREFLGRALERLRYSLTADRYSEWAIALKAKLPEAPSWLSMLNGSGGTAWYLAVCLLAALGAGAPVPSPYRSVFLVILAVHLGITAFIESAFRYKLALVPYFLPMAASAVTGWRWRWRMLPYAGAGALVVVLSVPLIWPAMPKDLYAHALYGQGRLYELFGYAEGAELSYRRAMLVDAEPDFYLALARVLASRDEGEQAKALLREASSRWAEDPRACAWRAHLARHVGDTPTPCSTTVLLAASATRWAWDRLPIAPRSAVDIGEDDLGYVLGFYGPEGDGGMHRWTSDRAVVRLWAPSSRVFLRIRCTTGPLPAAGFRVEISGAPVAQLEAPQGIWADYRVPLPGQYRPGQLLIVVLVPDRVQVEGNGRRLGIVVSHVALEPVRNPEKGGPSGR